MALDRGRSTVLLRKARTGNSKDGEVACWKGPNGCGGSETFGILRSAQDDDNCKRQFRMTGTVETARG
ncbi:MAG: hypothetical protein JWQ42_1945 [Edaphobacter sp.]|nr:hypothetical protein [Edaphobacter sp.]